MVRPRRRGRLPAARRGRARGSPRSAWEPHTLAVKDRLPAGLVHLPIDPVGLSRQPILHVVTELVVAAGDRRDVRAKTARPSHNHLRAAGDDRQRPTKEAVGLRMMLSASTNAWAPCQRNGLLIRAKTVICGALRRRAEPQIGPAAFIEIAAILDPDHAGRRGIRAAGRVDAEHFGHVVARRAIAGVALPPHRLIIHPLRL